MSTPETSLARVEAQPRTNRTELYLRLAKIEEERSRTLVSLGLADAGVSRMDAPMIDTSLNDALEKVLERVARLEAKLFADGIVASVQTNGAGHHEDKESDDEPEAVDDDEKMIADKAKELGCPKDWLFIMTARGGRRFAQIRKAKRGELEKIANEKSRKKSPDEQAMEAMKLDNKALMAWCRGDGKALIVGKRSGLTKAVRKQLNERVLSMKP